MLYEDEMQLYTPDTIVPGHGRESRMPTDVCESFTPKQLDALAPIDSRDMDELSFSSFPRQETLDRMKERIEAARRLKYGS